MIRIRPCFEYNNKYVLTLLYNNEPKVQYCVPPLAVFSGNIRKRRKSSTIRDLKIWVSIGWKWTVYISVSSNNVKVTSPGGVFLLQFDLFLRNVILVKIFWFFYHSKIYFIFKNCIKGQKKGSSICENELLYNGYRVITTCCFLDMVGNNFNFKN